MIFAPLMIIFLIWLFYRFAVQASGFLAAIAGAIGAVNLVMLIYPNPGDWMLWTLGGVVGFFGGAALFGGLIGTLLGLSQAFEDQNRTVSMALFGAYVALLAGPSAFIGGALAVLPMGAVESNDFGTQALTVLLFLAGAGLLGYFSFKRGHIELTR